MNGSRVRSTRQTTSLNAANNAVIANDGDLSRPGSQNAMGKWVEPQVRVLPPSFKDAGMERHGVLENMQPLGTLPTEKLKRSLNIDSNRRITLVSKGGSAEATPSGGQTPEAPRPTSPEKRSQSQSQKIEDDENHEPDTRRNSRSRRSTTRVSAAGRNSNPQSSPPSSELQELDDFRVFVEKMEKTVEAAIYRAVASRRYPTAYALRTLFDDHRSNERILKIMEAVIDHTANEAQADEFKMIMTFKKKEGRRNKKAKTLYRLYGHSFSAGSRFAAVDLDTPSKTGKVKPEADSETVLLNASSPHREPSPNKRIKLSQEISSDDISKENLQQSSGENGTLPAEISSNDNGTVEQTREIVAISEEKRATRSPSISSSSSSLSSLDEELLREDFGDSIIDGDDARVAGTEMDDAPHSSQPITKAAAPKLHLFSRAASANSRNTNTSTQTLLPFNRISANSTAAFDSSKTPVPPITNTPFYQLPSNKKRSHKKITNNIPIIRALDPNDETVRLKRKARDITENAASLEESSLRSTIPTRKSQRRKLDPPTSSCIEAAAEKTFPILRFKTGASTKQSNHDFEDLSSPTFPILRADQSSGSAPVSRAETPNRLTRASKKGKTGPRTKSSPMKKKSGTLAGIPRASGERNSPVGNNNNQDDNDDYCSSCGGNGDLVCCDGCTRSFHFACVDPPMVEGHLPDTWYCNVCAVSRHQPILEEDAGPFDTLIFHMENKNPSAFRLSKDIREYFEGVKTGSEGEYEEATVQRPKTRAGYDEAPDYLRLRDTKGNAILCNQCQRSSASGQPIIPCSFCGLSWHLDCLDPPLANPPPLGRLWRCPCHIDDLLAEVPGTLGPAHRYRRIKGALNIRPVIKRGLKNNGHVEIDVIDSDGEGNESGFYEQREYGHVYRLPEQGVKLDFISRIKRKSYPEVTHLPDQQQSLTSAISAPSLNQRTVEEQQAALNLTQLATQNPNYGTSGDAQHLIDALMIEANPEIITMIAAGSAPKLGNNATAELTQQERQSLLAMKALIERKLCTAGVVKASVIDGTIPPVAEAVGGSEIGKVESEDGVTILSVPKAEVDIKIDDDVEMGQI